MKFQIKDTQIFCFLLFSIFSFAIAIPSAHFWKFNEAHGSIASDSITGFPGTISNAEWVVNGKIGTAIHLHGTDQSYVSFGNTIGKFGKSDFTVSLFFKTAENFWLYDVLGDRSSFANGNFFSLRMKGDGTITFELSQGLTGAEYVYVQSKSGFNDNNWHQVVMVRLGTLVRLYVDGVLVGQNSSQNIISLNNSNPFKLGRSLVYPGYQRYSGNAFYDELKMYNVALSDSQIACLYNKNNNRQNF